MNSPVARLARLLMLALMLAASAWQPASAQQDSGPSVLRDSKRRPRAPTPRGSWRRREADASASWFLSEGRSSRKVILGFFRKTHNPESPLAICYKDSFNRKNPMWSERIQALEQKLKADP